MSRQRARIRAAVESRGYQVATLEWEPHYNGGEMSGICGGWQLLLDRDFLSNTSPGNDLYALSTDEMLAQIDYWLPPGQPCGCDRSHDPVAASAVINDPQRPTHGEDCRYHLRYRLPWWPSSSAASSPVQPTTEDPKNGDQE